MRTHRRTPASLCLACGLMALAACGGDGPGVAPRATVSPELFASTRLEDCGKGGTVNPSAAAITDAEFRELMHGVWLGRRVIGPQSSMRLKDDIQPVSHYVMILDMQAGTGMAYEESGLRIRENGFARLLPAPGRRPLRMVYLQCDGQFKEEFTKVSDDPSAGLRALARVTSRAVPSLSVRGGWDMLRTLPQLTQRRDSSFSLGALYTISTREIPPSGGTPRRLELMMDGRYQSTARELEGMLADRREGGVLEGVVTPSGSYMVGAEFASSAHASPCPDQTYATASDEEYVCAAPLDTAAQAPDPGTTSLRAGTSSKAHESGRYRMIIGPLP